MMQSRLGVLELGDIREHPDEVLDLTALVHDPADGEPLRIHLATAASIPDLALPETVRSDRRPHLPIEGFVVASRVQQRRVLADYLRGGIAGYPRKGAIDRNDPQLRIGDQHPLGGALVDHRRQPQALLRGLAFGDVDHRQHRIARFRQHHHACQNAAGRAVGHQHPHLELQRRRLGGGITTTAMVIQQALAVLLGNQAFEGHAFEPLDILPQQCRRGGVRPLHATIATDQQHGGAGAIEESAIARFGERQLLCHRAGVAGIRAARHDEAAWQRAQHQTHLDETAVTAAQLLCFAAELRLRGLGRHRLPQPCHQGLALPRGRQLQQRHLEQCRLLVAEQLARATARMEALELAVADDDWMRCMLDKGAHAGVAVAHRAASALRRRRATANLRAQAPQQKQHDKRENGGHCWSKGRSLGRRRDPALGVGRRAERQHEPRQEQRQ